MGMVTVIDGIEREVHAYAIVKNGEYIGERHSIDILPDGYTEREGSDAPVPYVEVQGEAPETPYAALDKNGETVIVTPPDNRVYTLITPEDTRPILQFLPIVEEWPEYDPLEYNPVLEVVVEKDRVIRRYTLAPRPSWCVAKEIERTQKQILSQTDYKMTIDYPMTEQEKLDLIEYRAKIREVNNKYEATGEKPVWPAKPE